MNLLKRKIRNKNGAVDLVVILIGIVIFAAVALYTYKAIGNSIHDGAKKSQENISNMLK